MAISGPVAITGQMIVLITERIGNKYRTPDNPGCIIAGVKLDGVCALITRGMWCLLPQTVETQVEAYPSKSGK